MHTTRTSTLPVRNSELSTFAQCRRKWYWAYGLQLELGGLLPTLHRGTIGHVASAAARLAPEEPIVAAGMALKKWRKDFLESNSRNVDVDELDTILSNVLEQLGRHLDFWKPFKKVILTEHQIQLNVGGIDTIVTLDALVEDENGAQYVLENKWVKTFRQHEQFDLDPQISLYYLAAKSAGYDVVGVILDQVAPIPTKPKLNLDGKMSIRPVGDRASYTRALIEEGLNPAHYQGVIEKLPETREFRRDLVTRSEAYLANFIEEWASQASELLAPFRVYDCNDRMRCGFCSYRELCIERMSGGDVGYIIENQFRQTNDTIDRHTVVEFEDDYAHAE